MVPPDRPERVRLDHGAPARENGERRLPQLSRGPAGHDPQREHAGRRVPRPHRETLRERRIPARCPLGDGVQLYATAGGWILVVRRRGQVSLDRQFSHRVQSRQPEALPRGDGGRCVSSESEPGLEFFIRHFFESDGCPKYYHDRTYPVDIQCAAQAIDTLAVFGESSPECLALGKKWRHGRSATCAIAGAFSTIANIRSSRRRHRCCTGARRRCSRDSASSSTRSARLPGIASLRRLFVPMQPSHRPCVNRSRVTDLHSDIAPFATGRGL